MSKNILEIKRYTKIYSDNKKAVDDLNITVKSEKSMLLSDIMAQEKQRPYVLLSALWILKKEKF